EEVDENLRVRRRQLQLAKDLLAQVLQVLEQCLIPAQLDVGQEHELRHALGVPARQAGGDVFFASLDLDFGMTRKEIAAGYQKDATEQRLQHPSIAPADRHAFLTVAANATRRGLEAGWYAEAADLTRGIVSARGDLAEIWDVYKSGLPWRWLRST